MSDWEDAPSAKKDEWEDAPSDVNQIPGLEGSKDPHISANPQAPTSPVDYLRGGIEGAAVAVTGMPAALAGGIAGLAAGGGDQGRMNEVAGKVMKELTYAPRTEKGQEYGEAVGKFANDIMNPLMGGIGSVHYTGRTPKAPPKPEIKARDVIRAEKGGAKWEDAPVQRELFDINEQGKAANPFEAQEGMWVKDENGIPIRADISMEAQNLQNPLQRNLWGDELAARENPVGQAAKLPMDRDVMGFEKMTESPLRTMENDLGITQALDNIPDTPFRGDAREVALDALRGKGSTVGEGIKAPGELEAAKLQAETGFRGPKSQRGGVNLQALIDETPRLKDLFRKLIQKDSLSPQEQAMIRALEREDFLGFDTPQQALKAMIEGGYDFGSGLAPSTKSAMTKLSQRGAVNPEVFKEGFQKLKQMADGGWLRAYGTGDQFKIDYIKDSRKLGEATFDAMDKNHVPSLEYESSKKLNLESSETFVDGAMRGKGIATEIYKFASELGNDIKPSDMQTIYGKMMWEKFHDKGFAKDGTIRSPGNKQGGGINNDFLNWPARMLMDSFTGVKSHIIPPDQRTPRPTPSPEQIAENQKLRQAAENFPVRIKALDEFAPIKTKEEALALAKDAKDIAPDFGQKQLGSGTNFQAVMSNNPVIKFMRTVMRDARVAADAFSRRYITAKDVGLSSLWSQLDKGEKIAVMEALMEGDREQFRLNGSVMDKLQFSEKQRQFVETFYNANNELYTRWNEKLKQLGLETVDYREGHFPGIFVGSYKSVVVVGEGKKTRAVGVIAVDTKAQFELAKENFQSQFPGVRFTDVKRQTLAGVGNRYYSDIFSGMNDVMAVLSKEDPRFGEVQDIVSRAVNQGNNALFNFQVHELAKKGVLGNEGNKPWLSRARNAEDAFKALVRYFEEGALHHELQVPLKDLHDLTVSPELRHLPNTMKYVDKYIKKATGKDLNPLGAALNTIIDMPMHLVPNISWNGNGTLGQKIASTRVNVGVGPSVPLKMSGAIKNTMSQMFMGFGNYMFTVSQLVQPGQTGLPFMQLAATRLGLNPAQMVSSFGAGGAHFMLAGVEHMTGKRIEGLPEHMRQAFKYAADRGLLEFSEIERAYQGTQNKLGRMKDQMAEANMRAGEMLTRTPMFMAYTDLLVKGGVDIASALPIAENLTQFSMIDYHAWERPMMYSGLGVTGGFMAGLTTFKHGLASQQTYLVKQGVKPTEGTSRQFAPAIAAAGATFILAGITGMPFYSEMDKAYQALTNAYGDESRTIREDFLANLSEWMNSGLVSDVSGLNLQMKFSSADMIPDTMGKALSPHLDAFGKIIGDAIDFAKNGDAQSVRNLMTSITPSGWKGVPENVLSKDAEGDLIGRDGYKAVHRTQEEWKTRAVTGLRPQHEAVERERTWSQFQKKLKDDARKEEIRKEYERRINNNTLTDAQADRLQQEYLTRKGEIQDLLELEVSTRMKQGQTQKERLEGIPRTPAGINRFNYYNQ